VRRPHGNCYWVEPRLLLAGEYPALADPVPARRRLGTMLDAGIRSFLDLTELGELPDYQGALAAEAELRGLMPECVRHPIRDMGVPDDPATMRAILDHIDDRLARELPVYVHCHAGVGRTGTVVGCWLARHGRGGEQALHTLAQWWRRVEKSWLHDSTPQTEAQRDYIRRWPAGR